MLNFKKVLIAGTLAVGLIGVTAYAAGTFDYADNTQQKPVQTILTSGGESCCADEAKGQKAMAHNAVFQPTAQNAAQEGGGCPYTAEQQKASASASCGDKTTMQTTAMMADGASCEAKAQQASMATGAACGDKTTMQTTAMMADGAACGDKMGAQTTAMASANGQSCCAMEGTKTAATKTAMAGAIPAAKTAQ